MIRGWSGRVGKCILSKLRYPLSMLGMRIVRKARRPEQIILHLDFVGYHSEHHSDISHNTMPADRIVSQSSRSSGTTLKSTSGSPCHSR